MTCGIYAIVNRENWRSYVGSSVDIENRSKQHFAALRNHKHINKELQADFNESFMLEILQECPESVLLQQEKYWIIQGYNLYNKSKFLELELTEKDEIRFKNLVDVKSDNECWLWNGATRLKNRDGYGKFVVKGQHLTAHKCAYYFHHKEWPLGIIRHKCHNKLCCNPNHLIDGSFAQNKQDDMLESRLGKLNWEQVNELREYFKSNPEICQHELAYWFEVKFGIKCTPNYLINICKNKTWKDKDYVIPTRPNQKNKKLIGNKNGAKITWDIVNDIRYNLSDKSLAEISFDIENSYSLKLSKQQISRIIRNERWYDESYNQLAIR